MNNYQNSDKDKLANIYFEDKDINRNIFKRWLKTLAAMLKARYYLKLHL